VLPEKIGVVHVKVGQEWRRIPEIADIARAARTTESSDSKNKSMIGYTGHAVVISRNSPVHCAVTFGICHSGNRKIDSYSLFTLVRGICGSPICRMAVGKLGSPGRRIARTQP
jgi:hypothetical protein